MISEGFPCNYYMGCIMILAFPKDPTDVTDWGGFCGTPSRHPLGPTHHPPAHRAPCGLGSGLDSYNIAGIHFSLPNPLPSFLHRCDHELLD